MTECRIDDCHKSARLVRGMCPQHYTRWRRHGDPNRVYRYTTWYQIALGFMRYAQVNQRSACWRWLGVMGGNERPYLGHHLAYRVAYELLVGPIPEGMEIDHLCGNGKCVNPGHLEAVTPQENKARRAALMPDQCGKGHPRPTGQRCKVCDQAKERRRTERRRAAREAARAAA